MGQWKRNKKNKSVTDYKMQLMLNLYDLKNIKNENNRFEIDYIKII